MHTGHDGGDTPPYSGDDLVVDCPGRQVNFKLPEPVIDKIGLLVDAVIESGGKTSRNELGAAILALCNLDGEQAALLLRDYRTRHVSELPQPNIPSDNEP